MKNTCPLPEGAIDMMARRFAVLGEPMRLRLLRVLFEGEKNVTALVELSGANQSNVSRHLQTLALAGIIGRRKEGLEVYYFIADRSIYTLCQQVCGSLEKQASEQAKALSRG